MRTLKLTGKEKHIPIAKFKMLRANLSTPTEDMQLSIYPTGSNHLLDILKIWYSRSNLNNIINQQFPDLGDITQVAQCLTYILKLSLISFKISSNDAGGFVLSSSYMLPDFLNVIKPTPTNSLVYQNDLNYVMKKRTSRAVLKLVARKIVSRINLNSMDFNFWLFIKTSESKSLDITKDVLEEVTYY